MIRILPCWFLSLLNFLVHNLSTEMNCYWCFGGTFDSESLRRPAIFMVLSDKDKQVLS